MLSWHFVTAAQYYATPSPDAEALYFLSDTHEIYRGNVPFGEAVAMVDTSATTFDAALAAITNPARRKIYIDSKTLEGRIYDGSAWKQVIRPVVSTVTETGVDPVSGKAVYEHVAAEIKKVTDGQTFVKNITYNKDTHALAITGGEGAASIELEGLGVELSYDKNTGKLELKDMKGVALGTAVNLDLERFVSDAKYDADAKKITLSFNDASTPLEIPVGDLVDTYTAGDTSTLALTVSANKFTGSVKVSATEGNLIQVEEDGLYVAPVDLSTYMKLVSGAVENDIATFGANGQVKDSGKKVGGATLAETTDANTLSTEAAVAAAIAALKSTLEGEIAKKITKMSGATVDNLVAVAADGEVKDSGKKVGGAALAASTDANTLATEKAVETAIATAKADCLVDGDLKTTVSDDDTDATIPTSKAVADALKWSTTM